MIRPWYLIYISVIIKSIYTLMSDLEEVIKYAEVYTTKPNSLVFVSIYNIAFDLLFGIKKAPKGSIRSDHHITFRALLHSINSQNNERTL